MPKTKPTKTELARFKAMSDIGLTPNAIGNKTGRDPKTVRKWLQSEVYEKDEDLRAKIEIIKERELQDLYLLGAKARANLHKRFDEGSPKIIESVATIDRCFQQRRELEGKNRAAAFTILVQQVNRSDPNMAPPIDVKVKES